MKPLALVGLKTFKYSAIETLTEQIQMKIFLEKAACNFTDTNRACTHNIVRYCQKYSGIFLPWAALPAT